MNWKINLPRFLNSLLFLTAALFVVSACAQSPAPSTASGKISGNFNCELNNKEEDTSERLSLSFEIEKNIVKKFSSSWVLASDDPSLRPGYAVTSNMNLINDLRQDQQSDGIVLRLQPGRHTKGQENCEIKIQGSNSSIELKSSRCSSPSLMLDLVIDRNSGSCRKANGIARYVGHYRKRGFTSCFQAGPNGKDVLTRCDVEDTLTIKERTDGEFDVAFSIMGANFHECAMSGFAVQKENTLEHRFKLEPSSGAGLVQECVLIFKLDEHGVLLRDDPNIPECKRKYCGQRAGYNGARFYLREKQQH